ncbi:MAG: hypothetical protein AB8G05_15890 [Oligoflexales bacterium]
MKKLVFYVFSVIWISMIACGELEETDETTEESLSADPTTIDPDDESSENSGRWFAGTNFEMGDAELIAAAIGNDNTGINLYLLGSKLSPTLWEPLSDYTEDTTTYRSEVGAIADVGSNGTVIGARLYGLADGTSLPYFGDSQLALIDSDGLTTALKPEGADGFTFLKGDYTVSIIENNGRLVYHNNKLFIRGDNTIHMVDFSEDNTMELLFTAAVTAPEDFYLYVAGDGTPLVEVDDTYFLLIGEDYTSTEVYLPSNETITAAPQGFFVGSIGSTIDSAVRYLHNDGTGHPVPSGFSLLGTTAIVDDSWEVDLSTTLSFPAAFFEHPSYMIDLSRSMFWDGASIRKFTSNTETDSVSTSLYSNINHTFTTNEQMVEKVFGPVQGVSDNFLGAGCSSGSTAVCFVVEINTETGDVLYDSLVNLPSSISDIQGITFYKVGSSTVIVNTSSSNTISPFGTIDLSTDPATYSAASQNMIDSLFSGDAAVGSDDKLYFVFSSNLYRYTPTSSSNSVELVDLMDSNDSDNNDSYTPFFVIPLVTGESSDCTQGVDRRIEKVWMETPSDEGLSIRFSPCGSASEDAIAQLSDNAFDTSTSVTSVVSPMIMSNLLYAGDVILEESSSTDGTGTWSAYRRNFTTVDFTFSESDVSQEEIKSYLSTNVLTANSSHYLNNVVDLGNSKFLYSLESTSLGSKKIIGSATGNYVDAPSFAGLSVISAIPLASGASFIKYYDENSSSPYFSGATVDEDGNITVLSQTLKDLVTVVKR